MTGQHYGTQQVIRACIRPGMLIRHEGLTWKAGANTRGKLVISTLRGSKCLKDFFVDVLLDARGEPLGNYPKDIQWTGKS
ncbi:cell division inhibitor protein [Kosakonia sacchari]|uniref:cell division inhibitor protein n=1 Tax=Kosakonia sacchari TaxID=1158459 RepID=UPI002ACD36C3|nr:cell division inhibitor protein [Kosakonia sacchari]MDZ7320718.1 cell division inhibitor protein [Kosakonia sacchari]